MDFSGLGGLSQGIFEGLKAAREEEKDQALIDLRRVLMERQQRTADRAALAGEVSALKGLYEIGEKDPESAAIAISGSRFLSPESTKAALAHMLKQRDLTNMSGTIRSLAAQGGPTSGAQLKQLLSTPEGQEAFRFMSSRDLQAAKEIMDKVQLHEAGDYFGPRLSQIPRERLHIEIPKIAENYPGGADQAYRWLKDRYPTAIIGGAPTASDERETRKEEAVNDAIALMRNGIGIEKWGPLLMKAGVHSDWIEGRMGYQFDDRKKALANAYKVWVESAARTAGGVEGLNWPVQQTPELLRGGSPTIPQGTPTYSDLQQRQVRGEAASRARGAAEGPLQVPEVLDKHSAEIALLKANQALANARRLQTEKKTTEMTQEDIHKDVRTIHEAILSLQELTYMKKGFAKFGIDVTPQIQELDTFLRSRSSLINRPQTPAVSPQVAPSITTPRSSLPPAQFTRDPSTGRLIRVPNQ